MSRAALLALACLAASGCTGATGTSAVAGGSVASTTSTGGTSATTTTGTAGSGGATPSGPIDFCTGCALSGACTAWANGDIVEASGIAASAAHDGVYYLHNDSGDTARFFATNCAGDDLGTYQVIGATAVDWEDMERGPCGAKTCLFFADSGDNNEVRTDYAVYRVEEPASVGAGVHQVAATKFPFAYPDGSHDAETLLIHPTTGEMVIVTKLKQAGMSGVYAFPTPLTPDKVATLVKVGQVAVPSGSVRITAGDVHPAAKGVLLRTYTSLFFYALGDGQPIEAAFGAPPCEVPVMLELQGEAVTFTADGAGYVTASEKTGQSLHVAACN